jgi:hypothetical protein
MADIRHEDGLKPRTTQLGQAMAMKPVHFPLATNSLSSTESQHKLELMGKGVAPREARFLDAESVICAVRFRRSVIRIPP